MDTRVAPGTGTHFPTDLISNVNSSFGVRLTYNANGASIESVSDAASATIQLGAKGSGDVVIGNSSNRVRVGGGSTTALGSIQRYTVQFTEPDCPASTYVDSTYTVTGATTNASYKFTPRLILAAGYIIGDVRCSTADEVTIRWATVGASTASGSTNRGTLLQFSY